MAKTRWINFTELKTLVPIRAVLERYGFLPGLVEKKPGKLVGACPLHGGKGKSSFHVDTERNIFNCFSSCGGGNVLDLVQKVESCTIRKAAEKLCDWYGLTFERGARSTGETQNSAKVSENSEPSADADKDEQAVNPPLARPLAKLNRDHPYLVERGLTVPTIKTFGVGHATRGIMRGRIAIPIHNDDGELVAYAGRAVDAELAKEKGKYRLPDNFKKAHVLFNLNRAREISTELIVVEGFFDAMKVHQAGFENVVALMGSTLSEHQEQLFLNYADRLTLMFDGDDAGNKCLREFYGKLRRRLYLKEIHLDEGEQPDTLHADRIRELLEP